MRMKRTEADTGRWFAMVTPKGKRSREEKEEKIEMMKQVNQWKLGGEKEKKVLKHLTSKSSETEQFNYWCLQQQTEA